MDFSGIGTKLEWVNDRLRSGDGDFYLIDEDLMENGEIFRKVEDIMKEKGFKYVFGERTYMAFEKYGLDATLHFSSVSNFDDYKELDELLEKNKITEEATGASCERREILVVLMRERRNVLGDLY